MEIPHKKRKCSYGKQWENVYPWVKAFSIAHGGEYDLEQHASCETHKKTPCSERDLVRTRPCSVLSSLTQRTNTTATPAPVIFSDSEIAKKTSCGCTKAAAIVTDVLTPASVQTCLSKLHKPVAQDDNNGHTPFFSVASDASNHGTTKVFPLSVRYWTPELGLKNRGIDFYEDSDESSASIHLQITSKLAENDLKLDKISAYTDDNANLNYNKNNSVFQKLKADNSAIIKANCTAHTVHNCAKHAGDRRETDIESAVSKIFSHFAASAKRTAELRSVFAFVEDEYQAVLGHEPTRWLSPRLAVKRLDDNWTAINSYFLSLGVNHCPKSLWKLLRNDQDGDGQPLVLHVYMSFLNNGLKIFHGVVLQLEKEDMTVCELDDIMYTLKTELQHHQMDSFFGMETRTILQQFPDHRAAAIKSDSLHLYEAALSYLQKWYDFSDNYQKIVASLTEEQLHILSALLWTKVFLFWRSTQFCFKVQRHQI
uniref:Uncharacterized protein n=1 Tax=Sphaeramia orbicularis TaxID=375764 RepID=A0A672ZP06_9TELE